MKFKIHKFDQGDQLMAGFFFSIQELSQMSQDMSVSLTYFGPPHSTAEAFTNRTGCKPTGSMLRVLFSTASRTAEANCKRNLESS